MAATWRQAGQERALSAAAWQGTARHEQRAAQWHFMRLLLADECKEHAFGGLALSCPQA